MPALPHALGLVAALLPLVSVPLGSVPPSVGSAPAQETPGEPEVPTVHPALRAIGVAAESTMLFEGSIEVILPEWLEEMAARGGPNRGFLETLGSPVNVGDFWVWRSARGETLIVTKKRAPGLTIYRDGAIHLTRTLTLDGDTMIVESIGQDLRRLSDLEQLFLDLRDSAFETLEDRAPGVHVHRASVAALPEAPKKTRGVVIFAHRNGVESRTCDVCLGSASNEIRSLVLDVARESSIRRNGEDADNTLTTRISLDAVAIGEHLPPRVAAVLKEMRSIADEVEGG